MLIKNKKERTKPRLPTIDEFLQYKPRRLDFKWSTSNKGLVEIQVPKFNGNLGKSFCKLIKKDDTFVANMDILGSIVWKHCDGTHTIKQILDHIKKEFPEEKNIDQRLFVFLQQMEGLHYIVFE